MIFEWDEVKNETNIKKHDGISFRIAARIFLDNKRIEKYDEQHSTIEEQRWNAIGLVEDVLFVVFTERKNNIIRLISARKANQEEINEYYSNYDIR
ncbi:BrnT family toxin [Treponema sp. OMZ 792]|uniref:BrnT family toxin n=1 Tax=unclassified Treponema TaxID=2638727 RepID=UPI0020A46D7B|nr:MULTISPECIES: BrnT family toxin [unclassified Treponema]UTC67678.1 BrnT family toxin [Treponema sp. OMZ 789]UTC70406.1 BrnT family toxin [Treponema sp. OMZ 790]UTC73120.1 BrnT family toxin [Treponema sp. OMZ 791]UTC75730.1 BrnT family toxin [Treponema sp. OMZ 792]UTC78462.1 BrnT family toxin [Treponema sp. OMZ 799]